MKRNFNLNLSVIIILLIINNYSVKAQKKHSSINQINTFDKTNVKNSEVKLKTMFNLENQSLEFSKIKSKVDDLGFLIETYNPIINGFPLDLNTIKVISKNNQILKIIGNIPKWSGENNISKIEESFALKNAQKHVKAKQYLWENEEALKLHKDYELPKGELVYIYINGSYKLTYKFDIYALEPISRDDIYIDATSGKILLSLNKICTIHVQGSGQSLYNGFVNFGADNYSPNLGGLYRLHNTIMGGGVRTYDRFSLNSGMSDVTTSVNPIFNNQPAVQAHWGAEQFYQYLNQELNRASYDGQNAELISVVGDMAYAGINAYWDGTKAVFGKGNSTFNPMVSLDIVAHEFTHGLTGESANLIYNKESGALNESFSDIFAVAVDYFTTGILNWEIGEDIRTNNIPFRSLSNPKQYSSPDTYLGNYWNDISYCTPTSFNDYCFVHTNSGVQNHWFYLLSSGGNDTNDNGAIYNVNGIGIDKAIEIAYRNLTTYLNPNSNYSDARDGSIQSAIDLFGAGSSEVISTTNAWYAVGVGSEYGSNNNCLNNSGLTLRITADGRPENIAFFTQGNTSLLHRVELGELANLIPGTTIDIPIDTSSKSGEYKFTAYDLDGDGLTSGNIIGDYQLLDDQGNIILSKTTFDTSEAYQICVNAPGNYSFDLQKPTAPTNLNYGNLTSNSAELNWTSATDNTYIYGYYILVESNNIISLEVPQSLNHTLNNLLLGQTYYVSVITYDIDGNLSPYSNTLIITPVSTTFTYNGTWYPSDPNGVASAGDDIIIASGDTAINANTTCNSVTVNPGAGLIVDTGVTLTAINGLTFESSSTSYSSLILDGTVSGTLNYQRHVNINGSGTTGSNDLVSAPLTGQTFSAFASANPNILNNGSLYLFGPFDKTTGEYTTYSSTESATLEAGIGYRAASDDNSYFTFTGTANNGIVTYNLTNSGPTEPEWNLIGNPYPSYLKVQEFLMHDLGSVLNIQLFDSPTAAIYGYDGDVTDGWVIYNLATTNASTVIAPGQGFFVSADATNASLYDLEFTPTMRSTGSTDDFILGRNTELTFVKVKISTNSEAYATDIYFNNNASLGFDFGYDAQLLGETTPDFAIYSHLVQDNTGQAIALQALNGSDLANATIPLGVNANQGEQLTFSIADSNLPASVNVYLDDVVANISTLLNNSDYIITPATNLSGTGRFFLRTSEDALSTIENSLDTLNIFALNTSKELVVSGKLKDNTALDLLDIQGRKVLSKKLDNTTIENRFDVSNLSSGIYVVNIQNNLQLKTQKVIIK